MGLTVSADQIPSGGRGGAKPGDSIQTTASIITIDKTINDNIISVNFINDNIIIDIIVIDNYVC